MVAEQPNAMLDDTGGFFFPDDVEDAVWFAREHGARPLHPEAFRAMFGEV